MMKEQYVRGRFQVFRASFFDNFELFDTKSFQTFVKSGTYQQGNLHNDDGTFSSLPNTKGGPNNRVGENFSPDSIHREVSINAEVGILSTLQTGLSEENE